MEKWIMKRCHPFGGIRSDTTIQKGDTYIQNDKALLPQKGESVIITLTLSILHFWPFFCERHSDIIIDKRTVFALSISRFDAV
jgi:hypothetical protein